MKEKLQIEKGSGNVFTDIGIAPDEAANLLFRATLMTRLSKIVEDRELTQHQAAKLFGVTQPRVNLLIKGQIREFSIDALVTMLGRAGISVVPKFGKVKALA